MRLRMRSRRYLRDAKQDEFPDAVTTTREDLPARLAWNTLVC